MGGRGSGSHYQWWRRGKKTAVEDCLSLDANRWTREGILAAGVHRYGQWQWTYRSGNQFSIGYEADTRDPDGATVRLSYAYTLSGEKAVQSANYRVQLTTTRPRFGGVRWWFVCPLVVDGRACDRRAGKLYLPPRTHYFGCRLCYRLTYTSCQESHQFDRMYAQMAFEAGCSIREMKAALDRLRATDR